MFADKRHPVVSHDGVISSPKMIMISASGALGHAGNGIISHVGHVPRAELRQISWEAALRMSKWHSWLLLECRKVQIRFSNGE